MPIAVRMALLVDAHELRFEVTADKLGLPYPKQVDSPGRKHARRTDLENIQGNKSGRRLQRADVASHHLPHNLLEPVFFRDVLEHHLVSRIASGQLVQQLSLKLPIALETELLAQADDGR